MIPLPTITTSGPKDTISSMNSALIPPDMEVLARFITTLIRLKSLVGAWFPPSMVSCEVCTPIQSAPRASTSSARCTISSTEIKSTKHSFPNSLAASTALAIPELLVTPATVTISAPSSYAIFAISYPPSSSFISASTFTSGNAFFISLTALVPSLYISGVPSSAISTYG